MRSEVYTEPSATMKPQENVLMANGESVNKVLAMSEQKEEAATIINMDTLKACAKTSEPSAKQNGKHSQDNTNGPNNGYDHYEPTVRLLKIQKSESGACGFHLTRSKWDPYPWVSAVDAATPAEQCNLKAGDCVLEVNGEDVLGLRITDIAKLVKAKSEYVTLLLWSTGWDAKCDPESLCCGPMPRSLQRLSVIVQSILSIIECPVCLDTIPPPAMQCQNGHLLCVNCRIRAEKCPVCRDRYTPRRALIAEQIYTAITTAFNLCRNEDKLRQKLFGPQAKHPKVGLELAGSADGGQQHVEVNKSKANIREASGGKSLPTNKFLAKLLRGKACSMENLSMRTGNASAATGATGNSGCSGAIVLMAGTSTPSLLVTTPPSSSPSASTAITMSSPMSATSQLQSCSNQFHNMANAKNHLTFDDTAAAYGHTSANGTLALSSPANNVLPQVNGMSKHFSLSTNDLSLQHKHQKHQHTLVAAPLIAIERCPSLQRLNGINRLTSTNSNNSSSSSSSVPFDGKSMPPSTTASTSSLLFLDKRRPCTSLSNSIECIRKRLLMPDVDDDDDNNDDSKATSAVAADVTASSEQQHIISSPSPCTLSSASTSSDVFTSPDTSSTCSASAVNKVELLSLSPNHTSTLESTEQVSSPLPPPPSPPLTAAAEFSTFQSSTSSSLSPFSSSVELSSAAAPVGTSSWPDMTLELSSSPSPSSSSLSPSQLSCTSVERSPPLKLSHKTAQRSQRRYRCPCDCGKSFNASSQLQRHVKVEHRLPILSYGGASARLGLPLCQPVDNAVLILEINNEASDACPAGGGEEEDDERQEGEDITDDSVKSDDKAQMGNKGTKECWIRIKMLGKDCVQTSALMQATAAECVDFMMETRLSSNQSNKDVAPTAEDQHKDGACWRGQLHQREQVAEVAEEVTRTRSIVHSMETTTWQATFNQQHPRNTNNYTSDNSDYKNGGILSSSNSGSNSNSNNGNANANNLSVISVLYHQRQHQPKRQQQSDSNNNNSNDGCSSSSSIGDLLLNIDVRRIN